MSHGINEHRFPQECAMERAYLHFAERDAVTTGGAPVMFFLILLMKKHMQMLQNKRGLGE
jgi:hypothetical protein